MKNLLIFLMFLCNGMYSQTGYFELRPLKKTQIRAIESAFQSKPFTESQSQVSANKKNWQRPISYFREATADFPPAVVQYFYMQKDSLANFVTFNWEINIEKNLSQSDKVKRYNTVFDALVKSMAAIFGDPGAQGEVTAIESPVENDKSANFERKVIWKKESKTVTALIVWAENHGEQMITTIQ